MPNTTSNHVNQMLKQLWNAEQPTLVRLHCHKRGNDFLMEHVIERLQKQFSSRIDFIEINEPESVQIKEELKFSKSPALVFVVQGEIKLLFEGILPFQHIARAIEKEISYKPI